MCNENYEATVETLVKEGYHYIVSTLLLMPEHAGEGFGDVFDVSNGCLELCEMAKEFLYYFPKENKKLFQQTYRCCFLEESSVYKEIAEDALVDIKNDPNGTFVNHSWGDLLCNDIEKMKKDLKTYNKKITQRGFWKRLADELYRCPYDDVIVNRSLYQ